jgi:hypothetical protein
VVALVLEEAAAAAQGDGVDEELELVKEVVAQQCTHQRGLPLMVMCLPGCSLSVVSSSATLP